MSNQPTMRAQMKSGAGFIAALDQSGGSTPKALSLYGVEPSDYSSEAEMFQAMHDMRARIILADGFTSDKVIGAILFERTMNETITGKEVAKLLWEDRGVVPFLKIDKGLEDQAEDVQLLKPMPGLDDLLAQARAKGIFGTKERSVIHGANGQGIDKVVAQQFDVAQQVVDAGLVPIIEPEVNIHSPSKAKAEDLLLAALSAHLDALPQNAEVMLKLTLPDVAGLYDVLADHPNVLRIVALSGGYSTADACQKLSQNRKMIASFSRALTEGLSAQQDEAGFNAKLQDAIDAIHAASIT